MLGLQWWFEFSLPNGACRVLPELFDKTGMLQPIDIEFCFQIYETTPCTRVAKGAQVVGSDMLSSSTDLAHVGTAMRYAASFEQALEGRGTLS